MDEGSAELRQSRNVGLDLRFRDAGTGLCGGLRVPKPSIIEQDVALLLQPGAHRVGQPTAGAGMADKDRGHRLPRRRPRPAGPGQATLTPRPPAVEATAGCGYPRWPHSGAAGSPWTWRPAVLAWPATGGRGAGP